MKGIMKTILWLFASFTLLALPILACGDSVSSTVMATSPSAGTPLEENAALSSPERRQGEDEQVISSTQVNQTIHELHVRAIARAINVRSGPGTEHDIVAILPVDQTARILDSTPDNTWYQIVLDGGHIGWVGSSVVEVISQLPSFEADTILPTTVTLAPGLTRSEEEYLTEVMSIISSWGDAFSNIGRLMGQAGDRPSLFYNEDWKLELLLNLVLINVSSQEMQDVNAPTQFSEIHQDLLFASDQYVNVSELIANAMDALNAHDSETAADKLERALEIAERGNSALRRAMAMLEEEMQR